MADLDKKAQKSQPDLVQSVLDAFEKNNIERVDILITNALKQLKGARFKPDQSIYISLFYLARVQPKVFSQSTNLKEYLKTHIKRDGVPANIKGNKTDFFLPVLAANVLMASCDGPEVRATILTRIGQWISSNQKLNELVQHILAILCIRCQGDPITVKTLIEMRHQWFDFLDGNFDIYGQVAPDLAHSIMDLMSNASTFESFLENLTFLMKHDSDVLGLCLSISKFISEKPLTLNNILKNKNECKYLVTQMMNIFEDYFKRHSSDIKGICKSEEAKQMIVFNLGSDSQVLALNEIVVKALLVLMTADQSIEIGAFPSTQTFLGRWLANAKSSHPTTFSDITMTTTYQFPTCMLFRTLMQSTKGLHRELSIYNSTPLQLVELALSFGLPTETLDIIFERLDSLNGEDFVKIDSKDFIYFHEMMDHYTEMGVKHVETLRSRLIADSDMTGLVCKKADPNEDVKIKKEIT